MHNALDINLRYSTSDPGIFCSYLHNYTQAGDFKFAGAIVYLVMVAITHKKKKKKFLAHYAWFSRGWSHNYFIYFKAPD